MAGKAGPEGARGLVNRWINKRATAPFHPGFCKEPLASSGPTSAKDVGRSLGHVLETDADRGVGGEAASRREEGLGGGVAGRKDKGLGGGGLFDSPGCSRERRPDGEEMEGDPAGGGAEVRVRSSNLGGRVSEKKRKGVLNETGPNQTRFAREVSQPKTRRAVEKNNNSPSRTYLLCSGACRSGRRESLALLSRIGSGFFSCADASRRTDRPHRQKSFQRGLFFSRSLLLLARSTKQGGPVDEKVRHAKWTLRPEVRYAGSQ